MTNNAATDVVVTVLSGHVSPETSYHVESYPYGFTLRCQIRYWIETKNGHGQRLVSQTSNPKRTDAVVWNKPKASTYANLMALYVDGIGHVQHAVLSFYATPAQVEAFRTTYAAALTSERDQRELRILTALAARNV